MTRIIEVVETLLALAALLYVIVQSGRLCLITLRLVADRIDNGSGYGPLLVMVALVYLAMYVDKRGLRVSN